jgi:hypothetical protein
MSGVRANRAPAEGVPASHERLKKTLARIGAAVPDAAWQQDLPRLPGSCEF